MKSYCQEISVVSSFTTNHCSIVTSLRTGRTPWKARIPVAPRNITDIYCGFPSSLAFVVAEGVADSSRVDYADDVTRCCEEYTFQPSRETLDHHTPFITKDRFQVLRN